MAEALWVLFLVGVGVLWVALIYVSLSLYGTEDVDGHRSVWKVLLLGDREREEDVKQRSSKSSVRDETTGYGLRTRRS